MLDSVTTHLCSSSGLQLPQNRNIFISFANTFIFDNWKLAIPVDYLT